MMNRQIHWSSPDPFLEVLDIQEEPSSITFIVRSTHESCPCPHCQVPSTRPHSRYTRMIQDLPIAGKAVSIVSPKSNNAYKSMTPPCKMKVTITEEVFFF